MIKELEDAIEVYKKLGDETAVAELNKLAALTEEQQKEIFETAKKIMGEKK